MLTACAIRPVEIITPLPAHSFGPNIDADAYEGILRLEGPCVYLSVGGKGLNILWPSGYGLKGSPPVVVRDDGYAIATIGNQVLVGGMGLNDQFAPPGCSARLGFALGIVETVNGVKVAPARTQAAPAAPPMTERPKSR